MNDMTLTILFSLLALPLMILLVAALYAHFTGRFVEMWASLWKWDFTIRVYGFRRWFK